MISNFAGGVSQNLDTTRRTKETFKMPDRPAASRSRPSTKLRDILMSDKPALSYADFHHQITNADGFFPKSFRSEQTHGTEGKAEKDELVRYMSNLPTYLERGRNFQEKPLNVGVLDWRRLEKWKHNNNQVPHKNSGYSSSTSSTSYFSTERSSSHSSRGQSSPPAHQRTHRSSLQSHLEASPMKTYSQDEYHPGRGSTSSPSRQRTYHHVPHSHHQKVYPWEGCSQNVGASKEGDNKFEGMLPSIPDHRIRQESLRGMDQTCTVKESRVSLEMHNKKELASIATLETGKMHSRGNSDVVSSRKGKLMIQESESKEAMQSRKPNLGDYNPDCSKERNTVVLLVPRDPAKNRGMAQSSDLRSAIRLPKDCGGKSFSEQAKLKEVHGSDLSSNVPHSCPLPPRENSNKKSEMRESCSTSMPAVNVSSQQLKSPSGSRNNDEKKSIVVLQSSTASHLSGELANRTGSQATVKVRHPSPIRRLGSAMGNIIRSAGSRDNSPVRRSSSKDSVAKLPLDRAADSVASLNTDKSQANSRSRSSPLRRLLDPFKPKAANVCELTELNRKDSASTASAGPWKSSIKVKSTFVHARTKVVKDSHQNVKQESSPIQALFQVAVKNGLPLFTFAVDNDNDNILAATVKNSSGWIYTFLDVHETKKKNALWPNQGAKGKGQYVPNVVAQMTRTRQNCTDADNTREFTLFSVDVGQSNQHVTEFQPANELAAIVVKLDMSINPSQIGSQRDSKSPLSATLILPGGVHTIPSKGSVSTLTERWRSGGSCDCGGWDLGCQLRIFTNQSNSHKFLTASKSTKVSDEFKLWHQVGQESELVLSLNPFKDKIYSVEFDSSISLLQAFATCIAVLDCRRPSGFYSTREAGQSDEEAPASYVSYPPHSPVGRV